VAKALIQPREGLLLVDSLNFCFRYRSRTGSYSSDFIRDIRGFAASFACKDIIILADLYGSTYRKALHPEYKANRKKHNQTEVEKEQFKQFIEEYRRTLEVCKENFKVIILEGVEADDTIGYLTKNKAVDYAHIMVLSTDKDLDQLITNKVSRFSYITRKETNIQNFEESTGVLVSEFLLMKCLVGDAGDNILGVAGIGAKRGATLASDFCELELLLDAMPLDGKQKFIQNLNQSEKLLELNDKLMNLLDYQDEILTKEEIQHIEGIYNGNNAS